MSFLAREQFVKEDLREGEVSRFYSAYSSKLRVAHDFTEGGPGAKQSFKEECDINRIMAKSLKGQPVTWLNPREPRWGVDVTGQDFRASMDVVAKSREMFDELPSAVRKKFQNDPSLFLEWIDNPDNTEEVYKLGLAKRPEVPPEPAPVAVRVIQDVPGEKK